MIPTELEIKDTTETDTSASYMDLLPSIESDCQLHTHRMSIWRNCYHLANLHSGHVGCTPAAITYIVYIGKNT